MQLYFSYYKPIVLKKTYGKYIDNQLEQKRVFY
jgi:hypothetical protein